MSEINYSHQTISPLENVLLKTYQLKSQGRNITTQDKQINQELQKIDQHPFIGNNDGKTSLKEMTTYLDLVSAYQKDIFHQKYSQYRENIEKELTRLGEEIGVELIDPYNPKNNQELINYTKVHIVLLHLLDHQSENNELMTEIKNNGIKELTSTGRLFNKLTELYSQVETEISPQKKVEYVNKILHHKQLLNIRYNLSGTPTGNYGSQTPQEIFQSTKRRANCFELSGLATVMLRAIGIPALITDLDILQNKKEKVQINDQQIDVNTFYQHAVVEIYLDSKKYYYDPADYNSTTTFRKIISSDDQIVYENYSLDKDSLNIISALQNFYIESARELMLNDLENQNYYFPCFNKMKSLFETSFITDPTGIDEDFFEVAYKIKEIADLLTENINHSNLFLNLSKIDLNKTSYQDLGTAYLKYNPYHFRFINNHLRINPQDTEFLKIFIEETKLLKEHQYKNKTYLTR